MSTILKRATVIMLILVLGMNVTLSNPVFASTNKSGTVSRSNLVMLSTDLNHMKYTYDENGKSYKIIEEFDENLKDIESKVYEKNEQGNYELHSTIETVIEDGIVSVTTNQDGKLTTETQDLNPLINSLKQDSEVKEVTLNLTSEETMLTNWRYTGEVRGSTRFPRYTIAGITATLGTFVAAAVAGPLSQATIAGLTTVATIVFTDLIPLVYFQQSVYYKYILNTNPPLPRAEMTNTYFYLDSARTDQIGKMVSHEYYVRGWY